MNRTLHRIAATALGSALLLGSAGIALADIDVHVNAQVNNETGVRITNDVIRVNGATVTATSTTGFTATAATSSPVFTFNVVTDSATKFEFKGKGHGTITSVATGDTVNFRGTILSGTTSVFSVKATKVEDKTRHPVVHATTTASATTTAQLRIDFLNNLIARLQSMIAQIKIKFQLQ